MQYGLLTESSQSLLYYRGRVALFHLLKSLGVGPNDEVATQAFTCSAVPEGILASGARPLFIDTKAKQVNMDPGDLEQKITSATKAIVVQHTFGIPAEIVPIARFASIRGIPLIEDCCHVLSSQYNGKAVGTFGLAAFYSHEWGKPLPCGLGGSVQISSSELVANLLREYKKLGYPPWDKELRQQIQYMVFSGLYRPFFFWPLRKAFRFFSRIGVAEGNYNELDEDTEVSPEFTMRMSPRAARRLARKQTTLDQIARHSTRIADLYESHLKEGSFHPVEKPGNSTTVYSRFPIWCDDKKQALAFAESNNLELAEWYATPIHPLKGNRLQNINYTLGSCPNAELACRRILSLPTHRKTSLRQARKIATSLLQFS